VNYFAAGHSSECFGYVKDWVEKKQGNRVNEYVTNR